MKLIRSILTVGGFTVGSRLAGFVREVLTASLLGAGAASDALVVAIKLPSFFRRLFAEGAFNASFVPLFAGLLATEGKDAARTFAEQIFTLLITILLVLVLIVELFMPYLLPALVPGFEKTPERLYYAIEFSRVTFPFIFFISLTALYSGILNSFDRFAAVASSPMVGNLAIIAIVFGLHAQFSSAGYAFAIGVTACGVIQWLWVLYPAIKKGMYLRLHRPQMTPQVRKFFVVLGPAAFGSGIVQINLFIGSWIASWLPTGAISYLNFADRLNQLPLSVIGVAVSTALLPLLSKQIRAGSLDEASASQNLALEFSMFLTLPATLALTLIAHPLVSAVFERGAFGSEDSLSTAYTLMALALGLPAYVLIKVFTTGFFARQDTKTPIYTALAGIVVDIVLSLLLMGSLKQIGIALATAAAAWVNALLLGYLLWRKGHLVIENRLLMFFPRLLLACLGTGLILEGLNDILAPFYEGGELMRASAVMGLVITGLAAFFIQAYLLKIARFHDYKGRFAS
ncbi:Murein biosynthesis integral membrane protein MurJ [Candidatus Bealeia paramacronuclearis]|uniref:Probable lipid II flippase MurJ n=1 Tax=Candidatus Bealeia paramacronuclearis TaxID=1921001 RepID=A0ABZ2C5P4_9PROT|nr:Murein biosynthesis integral membrane protein MurJ [Candidatus Bealeia paramacronuclearis]